MITRLLVNELDLPEAILNQWTEFEHSQFVIQIRCPVSALPPLFFQTSDSLPAELNARNETFTT